MRSNGDMIFGFKCMSVGHLQKLSIKNYATDGFTYKLLSNKLYTLLTNVILYNIKS